MHDSTAAVEQDEVVAAGRLGKEIPGVQQSAIFGMDARQRLHPVTMASASRATGWNAEPISQRMKLPTTRPVSVTRRSSRSRSRASFSM
ncbi:MAG: hypothetical protein ACK50G_02105 [bacterium]